jgi:hypothetical protein
MKIVLPRKQLNSISKRLKNPAAHLIRALMNMNITQKPPLQQSKESHSNHHRNKQHKIKTPIHTTCKIKFYINIF